MNSLSGEHFDAVIIGASMSGLAAGIRLALFEKKVLILERHNAIGGLNGFYSINGIQYDVGLHAMTNYAAQGMKGAPLSKVFRQLRIQREEFNLSEQKSSRIAFPSFNLRFNNDFSLLESEVAREFPTEIDNFRRLICFIRDCFNKIDHPEEYLNPSARSVLAEYINEAALIEALLLPNMYYGSSQENDMDWSQFCIIFQSIFLEGLARPHEGIRQVLRVLKSKYKTLGGLRKMKCGVKKIISKGSRAQALELDDNSVITADYILSSAGLPETLRLCSDQLKDAQEDNIGRLSFVETVSVLNKQPQTLGWDETIIFFNDSEKFTYECPKEAVDSRSGVICIPNNYNYANNQELANGVLRTTALANYKTWAGLSPVDYQTKKTEYFKVLNKKSLEFLPKTELSALEGLTIATDMFTPTTVKRFTGHLGGAIYGSTLKKRDGRTHLENLFICGTDQGYLGIVGAMISGIAMANQHILVK